MLSYNLSVNKQPTGTYMLKLSRKESRELAIRQSRAVLHDAAVAAGSQSALASALNVSQAAISKWIKRGWVPLDRAVEIEELFGFPRRSMIDPKIVDTLGAE